MRNAPHVAWLLIAFAAGGCSVLLLFRLAPELLLPGRPGSSPGGAVLSRADAGLDVETTTPRLERAPAPAPSRATVSDPGGERPAAAAEAEDPGSTQSPATDPAISFVDRVIERAFTREGESRLMDRTDVRSEMFLLRHGADRAALTGDDFVALEEIARLHDAAVFEAKRAAHVERYTAMAELVRQGDFVQFDQDSPPPLPELAQGAGVGFLPGARLGLRRMMVMTPEKTPRAHAAEESLARTIAARDAAFRAFFAAR